MTNEELKNAILVIDPAATFEEAQFLNVNVEPSAFLNFMTEIRKRPELQFDYLFCLTAVDWKTYFTMVYHLRSLSHHHEMVVKVKLSDVNNPAIDTVSNIWRTAEFHEREVYDLFGIKFYKHPDLRRIFLDEKWNGWPLRKNYEDPNMIEL